MNIVLINHYAGSNEMGMEFRPYYMAREWIKAGHKVTIIAGDYSHLRKKNPSVSKDFEREYIDGIEYIWIRSGVYDGNGVKRAISMAKFTGKLWIHAKRIAKELVPDIVIASSTYPIDTYAAQRIANIAKAGLIHEVHDMWPATLIEIGGMSKYHPFVMAMQCGENSAYRHSDYVVSLPPYAKDYMVEHGLQEEKFVHINNGIVIDDWKNATSLPHYHKEVLENLKKGDKFIIGYFGGHALSNALDILINVAKEFKGKNNAEFVFVGEGVEKERLQQRAEEEKIVNVCFLPTISKQSVPNLVRYFDCIYIGTKNSSLYRFGISMNKIFDAMMSGKPLLYAVDAPNNFAKEYNCGISVPAGDVKHLKEGVEKLINMSEEERREMGQNGRKAVLDNFQYKILAEKFLEVMKKSKEKK